MTKNNPKTNKRARATAAPAGDTPSATRPAPSGKLGTIIGLLRQPGGATVAQMAEETGWQAHSVRGAIAGAIKKKHGLAVASEKTEAGRVYRVVEAPAAG